MAGLTDIKNNSKPLGKPNGMTWSTTILQFCVFMLVLALLFAIMGCRGPKTIVEKETFYKESFRDTTIYIQGETVYQSVSDTFLNSLRNHFKNNLKDTVRVVSKGGGAELQFYINQYGQLQAACEAKDKEIDLLLKTVEKFETSNQVKIKTEYRMPWWGWITILLCLALIINMVKFKIFR